MKNSNISKESFQEALSWASDMGKEAMGHRPKDLAKLTEEQLWTLGDMYHSEAMTKLADELEYKNPEAWRKYI